MIDDHPAQISHVLSGLPPGACVREFEVVSVLGSGKSSLTYKAHDHSLKLPRTIKEYLPVGMARRSSTSLAVEALPDTAESFKLGLKRFLAEGQHMAQFQHRVFREAIRILNENGTAYIVMPYYEGKTLRKLVSEGWRVNELGEFLLIILPILAGIELLHKNNYCHCDITPDNILMRDKAPLIILDFGAVQLQGVTEDRPIIDLSPGFAAKEQYESTGIVGAHTDIYAISALSYYILTGIIPDTSISRILHDSMKPLTEFAISGLPISVLEVIDRGLSVEPENRYQSVESFARSLRIAIEMMMAESPNPIAREMLSANSTITFTLQQQEILEYVRELRAQFQPSMSA
jgi:serine/threonine protein kinase